jgi:hypothetical protein
LFQLFAVADVQVSIHFCEDYRLEIGDKPMLLGIYAPVIYNDEEDDDPDSFWLIIFASARPGVANIDLSVKLTVRHPNEPKKVHQVEHQFSPPAILTEASPWGFMVPLPVQEAMKFGSCLEAEVTANGSKFSQWLRMEPGADAVNHEELEDETE